MARKSDEKGNEFGGREKYVSRNASQFQRLGCSLIIKVRLVYIYTARLAIVV